MLPFLKTKIYIKLYIIINQKYASLVAFFARNAQHYALFLYET